MALTSLADKKPFQAHLCVLMKKALKRLAMASAVPDIRTRLSALDYFAWHTQAHMTWNSKCEPLEELLKWWGIWSPSITKWGFLSLVEFFFCYFYLETILQKSTCKVQIWLLKKSFPNQFQQVILLWPKFFQMWLQGKNLMEKDFGRFRGWKGLKMPRI